MQLALPFALLLCATASGADRPDILLADFEQDTYPDGWKTTGTAFGKGPARGTLPNQMAVSGFLGKGLVNSYLGGDGSTGTLTSAPFKIERKYLNFLIGGGKHPKTCVNLLVGGKIVRTATGPNDKPGGTERLDWHAWDVGEWEGKDAVIEIVDGETGGWGHINADHFVLSDQKKQYEPVRRTLTVERRYLHLPVKTGAPMKRMKFVVGNETVREFDIELADTDKPEFWAFADVSAFKGKPLTIETVLLTGSKALDTIEAADDVPDAEKLYREKHRPLFHFTSRFGWLNDPNGLVFHNDEWHLFYQHNPFGVNWGNMHWGHAVSPDLVHWKELGIGLYPKKYGDWAFSGSAVVDKDNTSGWGTKESQPLVLAYTSTARGECIAYSNDKGRTWTEYDKNPVVKHQGRDPKLVWYEKGKHWVMAVYDEHDKKQWIAFYTSPDLKTWTFTSRIEGFFECPDLFELPVDGKTEEWKWILYAADGKYVVGEFDGKQFKPDHKGKKQLWYGNFYAAQTFDNAPNTPRPAPAIPFNTGAISYDGLPDRIQIGWGQGITFPGMPFNQQMTVPVKLTLHRFDKELQLRAWPIAELEHLREEKSSVSLGRYSEAGRPLSRKIGQRVLLADQLDAFDLQLRVELMKATGFTLELRGTTVVFDAVKGTLTCKGVTAPVKALEGVVYLRALVDRGSIELFFGHLNDLGKPQGRVALSVPAITDDKNRKVELIPQEGEIAIMGDIYRMKSAWAK